MQYLGDFLEDATVRLPFNTFSSDDPQASVTITNLVDADIKVHKDGSVTQIVTDGATIAIDFDAITGNHLITIDTSVHADYSTGSDYAVRIEGTTVDGGTINAFIGSFSIENRSSSLSATALANLELQYNTTGLTGETFPSSQAQVGNLATGSAAISVVAESDTVTTGTEVNTYAVTDEVDQTYHEITDVAGAMELYYQFDVGGNGVASSVQMTGRLNSANDSIGVYAYNWGGASWDQIGTMQGTGGTSDGVSIFNLLTRHTGTAANLGKVRVRGFAASGLTSATLYIDQAIVSFSIVAQSVGYANGAIWFNSDANNTNTEVYVDGTADNPVSTEAAVNTLIAATGLTRVEVAIDSTVTFATTHTSEFWTGEHWTAALGGQDFSGGHFKGADVSGVGTGTVVIDFDKCHIGTATIHQFHMVDCGYEGILTVGEAGDYVISGGHSAIAGATTPAIDTGAAIGNVNLTMPHYSNGIEIRNLNATGTDRFSISGEGQIIYAASSSGTVNQRGDWKVTNTGGVTIVADDNTTNIESILTDTEDMQPKLGTPAADMSADIAAVKVDTAASKVVTDEMVFTKTNELDVNTKSINDAEVIGDGNAVPWDGI